ncbi:hypothetical protein K7I13_00460 [Brucepastera parasyntrophica]|uniref:hypothetical protein n=1 Tax=Brucepastera parasyntrophica TaxID=2880008 RepID=UPI00210CB27F|nr:hypothetical protein [Brucepastera parasyntrophica]ULQ59863.1 hypothetical protein K7I13_00460 [Brucepastera parasyntrophica]
MLFLFTGCAGQRPPEQINPLSVLGTDALAYLVLPVSQNRELCEIVLNRNDSFAGNTDVFLNRAEILYAGVFQEEDTDGFPDFRVFMRGAFPKAAASMIFPSRKGWIKNKTKESGTWYQAGVLETALPYDNIVCISTAQNIQQMLVNLKNPFAAAPDNLPPGFTAYAENPSDAKIGLYVKDPAVWASSVFAMPLTLPVSYIEMYAGKNILPEGGYMLSLFFGVPDARMVRAVTAMLRIAFDRPVSSDGTVVSVTGIYVPTEYLAGMFDFLYF